MANIIHFQPKAKVSKTVQDVSAAALEQIMPQWEQFARGNRLNEYFRQCTPAWSQIDADYIDDVSALAVIEQKIGLEPQVCAPGFGGPDQLGWIACFRLNGYVVCTTFMPTEGYARAMNILMFLKVKRDLQ